MSAARTKLGLAKDYLDLVMHAGVLGFGLERWHQGSEEDRERRAEEIDAWVAHLRREAKKDGLHVEHREASWHTWHDQFLLLARPDGSPYDLPLRDGFERTAHAERDWGDTLSAARERAQAVVDQLYADC